MAKYILYILLFALVSCAKTGSEEIFSLNANYLVGDEFYMRTRIKKIHDDTSLANKDSIYEVVEEFKYEVKNDTIINNILCRTLVQTSLNTGIKEIEYLKISNDGIYRVAHSIFGDTNAIFLMDTPSLLIPRPARYRDSFSSFSYDMVELKFNINEQLTLEIGREKFKCLGLEYKYKNIDDPKLRVQIKYYYYERGLVKSILEHTIPYEDNKRKGYLTISYTSERYIP